MTDREFEIVKRTLSSGWAGKPIDETAYRGLLAPFDVEVVKEALVSMLGESVFVPKVSEIVSRIRDRQPFNPLAPARRREWFGEEVLGRVPSPPWLIRGRWFFPDVGSLRLTEGKRVVVSALGCWDRDGGLPVWESWGVGLLGSSVLEAA